MQLASDPTIISALRKSGYRATSQRIAICRVALSSQGHPSVQRIYREVKKLHPTVSLATVYKTLQVLQDTRLVQELTFVQAETRIDPNLRPHVNVLCVQCGTISDVHDQSVGNLVSTAASRAKFIVTGQRFDIYGICEKCAKKTKITAYVVTSQSSSSEFDSYRDSGSK
jgi:Fur family peroxide stress response transcriptional regulator